jgi:hypothetical protein
MPSTEPLPTIRELLDAFGHGVVAEKERRADVRRGSVHDHWAGVGAILFSREAQRDKDCFHANYLDTADGRDLTRIARQRFEVDRVVDTYGIGHAILARETAAAGGGTIWKGTRVLLAPTGGASQARTYVALDDVVVSPAALDVRVPVRAEKKGTGYAVSIAAEGAARVDDPLWDPSWRVVSLQCGDGTDFEKAAALRARARMAPINARKGYAAAIIRACNEQGAANVALFASNYGGDDQDWGLNVCYVSEEGFVTSERLIRACTAALERHRVCGADLMVLPMRREALKVVATVTLWDDPGQFGIDGIDSALKAALVAEFDGAEKGYEYSQQALVGVLLRASEAVQGADIGVPTGNVRVLSGTPPNFPAVLTRYTLDARDISLTYRGPD